MTTLAEMFRKKSDPPEQTPPQAPVQVAPPTAPSAARKRQYHKPLTVPQAAKMLHVSEPYVRKLVRTGRLRGTRVSERKLLIARQAVWAYRSKHARIVSLSEINGQEDQ
jgi:excisionase family DNA binding protein